MHSARFVAGELSKVPPVTALHLDECLANVSEANTSPVRLTSKHLGKAKPARQTKASVNRPSFLQLKGGLEGEIIPS